MYLIIVCRSGNVYWTMCSKHQKFKNPKYCTLALCIICDKCNSYDNRIFKEKQVFEILKLFN